MPSTEDTWPEWLDKSWSDVHTAIENEIIKALYHCYESADAAGMSWTTEGWISCSASNIMSWMKGSGVPCPQVDAGVERIEMPTYDADNYADWEVEDLEEQLWEIKQLFGWPIDEVRTP